MEPDHGGMCVKMLLRYHTHTYFIVPFHIWHIVFGTQIEHLIGSQVITYQIIVDPVHCWFSCFSGFMMLDIDSLHKDKSLVAVNEIKGNVQKVMQRFEK